MSDFAVKMDLARGRLPLRRLMEQHVRVHDDGVEVGEGGEHFEEGGEFGGETLARGSGDDAGIGDADV